MTGAIPIPDGMWDYASIDPETRRLFLGRADGVLAVNIDSGAVIARFVSGDKVHAVLPLPAGRALSTNGNLDTATLFEQASGKVIASVSTGHHPDSATFDSASGLAVVIDILGGDVTLIDPMTGTAPGRITVGGRLEFAAADGRGRVYINVADRNQVAVIDTFARKVIARYALPGCTEPTGLALDTSTGILVSACDNRKAIALHATDGAVLATLQIDEGPDAVILDSTRKLFFVPCGGSGTLIVISERDGAAPAVVERMPTANGARTGALDPKTGRLYLPAADPGKEVLQIGGRHISKPAPGTARILVLQAR
jgi:hypothetical protein